MHGQTPFPFKLYLTRKVCVIGLKKSGVRRLWDAFAGKSVTHQLTKLADSWGRLRRHCLTEGL